MTAATVVILATAVHLAMGQECSCGVRRESPFVTRVIGGEEALVNEFPWAALLIIRREGRRRRTRCGGTLVNDR